MKKMTSIILFCFFIQSAWTCTIFSLYPGGQHWIGRTFDWSYGHGMLFTNKKNVTKKGLKLLPTDIESTWTSKFGSVTFNQFGREFPNGGMNEAGLVIDALELTTSVFPTPDARSSFNELQFIQYVLDNYSSILELKKDLAALRISPVGSALHYFVCDVKACMTIEYINGVVSTHEGVELPISGLANNTYQEHIDYAKDFLTFGGSKPIVLDSRQSLDRFVRSNYNAKFIQNAADKVQTLFAYLQDVGSSNNRWQIIYNQDEKNITFRTQNQFDKQRKIELSQFDFNCETPVLYFDLDTEDAGDINSVFKSFDSEANLQVIKKSVKMQRLPQALGERLAIYPDETRCN